MKLYGFPPSPRTWQVRAVAAHLGIALEFEFVDLTKGVQRTPEYLALNPSGRAPTLVDGDLKLGETAAIAQYLASQTPNSLWPDDVRARADIMRWQSWQIAHWSGDACEPLLVERIVKQILKAGPPDEAIVARALEAFNREAKVLEAHLAKQRWLVGDTVTLADFGVAPSLFYAERASLPLADYRNIREWFGRVAALPCWGETAPQAPAAAAA
jgi:glutathione S-transferase